MKPSLPTRLISWTIRTSGVYRRLFSGGKLFTKNLAKNRATPLAEPTAKMLRSLDISRDDVDGRPVWTFAPKDRAPEAEVLYWHGGGYVYPATDAHLGFLAHMAQNHGWRITAPFYPLAPEHDAKHITGWALDFYRAFAAQRAGGPFLMGGDSAGGGLTATTVMLARDAGLPLPSALLLICPWLDADPSHPDQVKIEPRDAILTLGGIREAGQRYANGLPLTDMLVSPIHGSWDGLPPILAFGGGDDMLATDGRALKTKHPSTEYIEREGMIHDWPIFIFKESREAQRQMASFAAALT